MKKRGRPRTKNPGVDLGTPELQAKRRATLGAASAATRAGWPSPDLAAAENLLGVLLWQGFLHARYDQAKRMHDAGVMFAGWWVLVHPKTFAQGTLGRFLPGGSSVVDLEDAEANLRDASAYIGKDRQVLDAVINACVYQRADFRRMEKLRTGLCMLMEWKRRKYRERLTLLDAG